MINNLQNSIQFYNVQYVNAYIYATASSLVDFVKFVVSLLSILKVAPQVFGKFLLHILCWTLNNSVEKWQHILFYYFNVSAKSKQYY